MAKFRKVEFTMVRGNGYGQYKVIAENCKQVYFGKKTVVELSWWNLHKDKVYIGILVSLLVMWMLHRIKSK